MDHRWPSCPRATEGLRTAVSFKAAGACGGGRRARRNDRGPPGCADSPVQKELAMTRLPKRCWKNWFDTPLGRRADARIVLTEYKSTGGVNRSKLGRCTPGTRELQKLIRYSEKIAPWLGQTLQIDWSGVKALAGQNRVVLRLSETDSYEGKLREHCRRLILTCLEFLNYALRPHSGCRNNPERGTGQATLLLCGDENIGLL